MVICLGLTLGLRQGDGQDAEGEVGRHPSAIDPVGEGHRPCPAPRRPLLAAIALVGNTLRRARSPRMVRDSAATESSRSSDVIPGARRSTITVDGIVKVDRRELPGGEPGLERLERLEEPAHLSLEVAKRYPTADASSFHSYHASRNQGVGEADAAMSQMQRACQTQIRHACPCLCGRLQVLIGFQICRGKSIPEKCWYVSFTKTFGVTARTAEPS